MSIPELPTMRPLDPRQVAVLRAHGAAAAVPVLLATGVAELALAANDGPNGIVAALALLVVGWLVMVAPRRRWRRWSYAFTSHELHVASGWLTQVHTIVPVARVQHIDLAQGPAERRYGVATLVLHTAGTDHSRVTVPGLARADAESIRDTIRAHMLPTPSASARPVAPS
ncbi:PH domain-containing protein [Sphingomonas montana]|uniref:PH domain-containing protein n=1 Tax=Sphingomonas montana TaxID=1843236 RepID=UPI00096C60C7|nr:PH domain-containing protein [Sphingomonas montana]